MAEEVQATVARVASLGGGARGGRALSRRGEPSGRAGHGAGPEPRRDPVGARGRLLQIRRGRAEAEDQVSLTPCHAAIAETGTLMLISGAADPDDAEFPARDPHRRRPRATRWSPATRMAGTGCERAAQTEALPRAVNFITGPSRTADIEQHIELGAHGPRRLHIVLVEEDQAARSDENDEQAARRGVTADYGKRAVRDVRPLRGRERRRRSASARRECRTPLRRELSSAARAAAYAAAAARPLCRDRPRKCRAVEARSAQDRGTSRSAWNDPGRGASGARRLYRGVARRRDGGACSSSPGGGSARTGRGS